MTARLAEVITLYDTNARAIPDMLRQAAESIEAEAAEGLERTEAMVAVQLSETGEIQIYGWGECDNMRAIAMLHLGLSSLANSTLD